MMIIIVTCTVYLAELWLGMVMLRTTPNLPSLSTVSVLGCHVNEGEVVYEMYTDRGT